MTDDLVKRLRKNVMCGDAVIEEAANRIEKLEAALAKIAKYDTQAIAMDALRPGERIREKKDD